MSYTNYNLDIRHQYHVELSGWPDNVPFTSPSHITTSSALQAVRDALKSGICCWMTLSCETREALAKGIQSGNVTKKPRAPRADKGVKCGPRAKPIGKENIPPKKAQNAVARSLPPYCSAENVFTDEEVGSDE